MERKLHQQIQSALFCDKFPNKHESLAIITEGLIFLLYKISFL